MHQEAKALLNSLKCPICKGQIDLLGWLIQRSFHKSEFNFACINDFKHYTLFLNHWDNPPIIEKEDVRVYDGDTLYTIVKTHSNPIKNVISINKVDGEQRLLEHIKTKYAFLDGPLFDFQNITQDKLISRIRTLLSFS